LGGKDRSVDAKVLTTTNGVATKVPLQGRHDVPNMSRRLYVAAFLPKGGQSLLDLTKLPEGADEQVLANVVVEGEPPVAVMPAAASRHAFYGSCTKDVAAWAIARQCPQPVSPACEFSAPKRRITEQLPNDRQVGDYRFVRRISTDKRPCVHRTSDFLLARNGVLGS